MQPLSRLLPLLKNFLVYFVFLFLYFYIKQAAGRNNKLCSLRLIKNLYNATETVDHANSLQYKYVFFKGFTLIRQWECSNQLMGSLATEG